MTREFVDNRDTPVCIYFNEGQCFFRGVSRPSLAEIKGGKPIRPEFSDQGQLVNPSSPTTILCGGRLRFESYRGVYQKANCNQYASYEPKIRLR